jgi:hypothetical protein
VSPHVGGVKVCRVHAGSACGSRSREPTDRYDSCAVDTMIRQSPRNALHQRRGPQQTRTPTIRLRSAGLPPDLIPLEHETYPRPYSCYFGGSLYRHSISTGACFRRSDIVADALCALPGAHNRTYRPDLQMPWSATLAGPLELSQVPPPCFPATSGVFYVGTSTRCEFAQVRALPPGRSVSPARPCGRLPAARAGALHASPESDAIIVPRPQDMHSSA